MQLNLSELLTVDGRKKEYQVHHMQFDHVEDLLEFGEMNTICMNKDAFI